MLIPNSEKYDENGNLSHFGIIDPTTNEPSLIPHVGGNYGMFGGNGALQLNDNGGGGANDDLSDTPDRPDRMVDTATSDGSNDGSGDGVSNFLNSAGNAEMGLRGLGATPVAAPSVIQPITPKMTPSAPDLPLTPVPAYKPTSPNDTSTPAFDNIVTTKAGSSQAQVDPSALRDLNKQTELGAQATEAEHKALIAESIVRQKQADAQANAIADHQQAVDAARQTYQANIEKKQQEIQESTDKFLNTPLDANHFWADKGTGDKVMAGIAIALGALGGAMNGSNGNVGLDVINKAIERDLKVQELNMQKQQAGISMKRGLLSDYMNQYGDLEKAKEASFIAYQKGVAQHFESMAMASKDPGTQAIGLKQAAAIRADADMRTMELTKKTVTKEETSAPIIKTTKASDKAQEKVNQLSLGIQKNQELDDYIGKNASEMGRLAGGESLYHKVTNTPQNEARQKINLEMKSSILKDLTAAGRVNPEKSDLIKEIDDNPNMNAVDAQRLLRLHRSDMQRELDMETAGARARREMLNIPQAKQSVEASNAELIKKRK